MDILDLLVSLSGWPSGTDHHLTDVGATVACPPIALEMLRGSKISDIGLRGADSVSTRNDDLHTDARLDSLLATLSEQGSRISMNKAATHSSSACRRKQDLWLGHRTESRLRLGGLEPPSFALLTGR